MVDYTPAMDKKPRAIVFDELELHIEAVSLNDSIVMHDKELRDYIEEFHEDPIENCIIMASVSTMAGGLDVTTLNLASTKPLPTTELTELIVKWASEESLGSLGNRHFDSDLLSPESSLKVVINKLLRCSSSATPDILSMSEYQKLLSAVVTLLPDYETIGVLVTIPGNGTGMKPHINVQVVDIFRSDHH